MVARPASLAGGGDWRGLKTEVQRLEVVIADGAAAAGQTAGSLGPDAGLEEAMVMEWEVGAAVSDAGRWACGVGLLAAARPLCGVTG
jgi:hypothetical protein